MLHRDYLLKVIKEFSTAVSKALRKALLGDAQEQPAEQIEIVEAELGRLLDFDPKTALALAPDSLIMVLSLSGVGEAVSQHIAWTLDKLADVYENQGDPVAQVRREQASAIAEHFGFNLTEAPEGFEELAEELR
ncbi:MAG: hypothetical protein IJ125_05100 [Atopobiaceae bacterium]|nr:hypothetical protein [Atopobiaceae bacterium]